MNEMGRRQKNDAPEKKLKKRAKHCPTKQSTRSGTSEAISGGGGSQKKKTPGKKEPGGVNK